MIPCGIRTFWWGLQNSKGTYYISIKHYLYLPMSDKPLWYKRFRCSIKSGTAVFTDHCVMLLDDQPQTNSAGLYRQGGKNISVYDYGGNLLKSIDLSFIYEEYPNTHHCELIFADGNTVFLQGYIGMDNGMTSHLYQIDWEGGTAREINSWPASDVPYDDTVKEFVISGGKSANASALPAQTGGDISSIKNGSSGVVTLDERAEQRQLKNEGSMRGEIEVTHKLSVGNKELLEGETVLFNIKTKSADSELKITLIGAGTGTVLEGSVTGAGDISFGIDTADEYTVTLENWSLRAVQFTIDYSIGGSK